MSDFIKPALAYPFEEKRLKTGTWIAEQKWDGHRMMVRVEGSSGANSVECWSRTLKPMDNVPRHVREALRLLPPGVYDGELVERGDGGKSYGVSSARGGGGTGAASATLVFVAFDLLVIRGRDLVAEKAPFMLRRAELEQAITLQDSYARTIVRPSPPACSTVLKNATFDEVYAIAKPVWARGGEGLILKEVTGEYRPGKRMQTWMKVKRLETTVVTLIGFESGLMGRVSRAVLRDDAGNVLTVKWKDHAWLEEMLAHGEDHIGRRVRIEFTERTEREGYREPRWDRFEDEGEPGERVH